jgi:surfactin synthase thioesterase subunit
MNSSALVCESLFIRRAPRPKGRLRLFCIPYAGAGASIYNAWPDLLPPEIEVVAIQLPGREDRIFEQPFSRLGSLVRTVVQAVRPYLHTPFAFFGYCCGALLSYELTKELKRRFGVSPAHLIAASQPAPHLPHKEVAIHLLPNEEFKQSLWQLNGTAAEILQDDSMMQLLLPALRADFLIYEQYVYQPGIQLSCPITALGGALDPRVSRDDLDAWKDHTTNSFSVRLFEGGHFFVNESLQDTLDAVVSALL